MARPARFSRDDILDAAARAVAEDGRNATLAQVSAQMGGPTGSIYHRFASRDELFVSLWIRAIRRFHSGLMVAYTADDPHEALMAATRHVPVFCRENPADALAMTLYRQSVLAVEAPENLRSEVAHINDDIDDVLGRVALARFGRRSSEATLRLAMVATRRSPFGLVRPYVGGEVPAWLDDVCVAAARGILALGDGDTARLDLDTA